MKIKKLLIGANALLVLGLAASCSNNEPSSVNGVQGNGTTRYMAVRIQSVGDFGTRAGEAGDYESAEGTEGTVTADDLRFFFFNADDTPYMVDQTILANGNTSVSNMVKPTTIAQVPNSTGASSTIEGVLVLHIPEGYKANPPAKVVCLANLPNYRDLDNINLTALTQATINQQEDSKESKFIMSTSAYKDGAAFINYTNVTDKIKTSEDEAKTDPANIYIERLAAKIRVNPDPEAAGSDMSGSGFDNIYIVKRKIGQTITNDSFTINVAADETDDKSYTNVGLVVKLTGWLPINNVTNAHAVKQLNTSWTDDVPFSGWTLPSLHRSCYAVGKTNPTYGKEEGGYNLYTATGIAEFTKGQYYTYENTNQTKPTKMVVRAVIYKNDGTETAPAIDGGATPVDFYSWGGYYYTEKALKDQVIAKLDNGTTRDQITLELDNKTNARPNTYVAKVDGVEVTGFNGMYHWDDGITSYVITVAHTENLNAVIRNHIYDYTFNNVIGLGIPGNIPQPPVHTDTFLAARIHILNWHVIKHPNINLGE